MELRQSTFALTLSLRHPAIFSSLFDDSSILCIPEIYVSSKINPNSIKDSTLLNHALRTPSSASSTPTEHTRLIGKSLSVSSFKTAVDSNHITAQFSGSPAVQSKFGTMVNNVLRRANSSSTLKLSPSQTWLTTDDLSAANNNSVGVDSLSSAAPAELFVSLTQKSVELHRETGIVRTREGKWRTIVIS
jgi:hypothetical protein